MCKVVFTVRCFVTILFANLAKFPLYIPSVMLINSNPASGFDTFDAGLLMTLLRWQGSAKCKILFYNYKFY